MILINRLIDWVNQAAEWKAGQKNPHVPVNEGIGVALLLHLTFKGKGTTAPPGSPEEGEAHILGASPSGAWSTFTQDNIAYYYNGSWREMAAVNNLTVTVDDGSGRTQLWRYVSGTGWVQSLVLPTAYDIPVVKGATPTANEVLARFTLARDVDFPADFGASMGSVETNPAATFNMDVRDDGVSIGTVSVSTSGVYTFTTGGGTAKTVLAGSKVEVVAPDPADASVDGISFMLRGSTADF